MVVVNLKGVNTGFDVVPEGDYVVRLTNHLMHTSKAGFPAFKVIVTIIDPEEFNGKTLAPFSGSLQPNSLFGFKRIIAAFGAPEDVLEHESVNSDSVLRELRGNEANVHVTVEPYNGRNTNKIYFYMPGELENMASVAEAPPTSNNWEAPPTTSA
jgi:hypothetical protein